MTTDGRLDVGARRLIGLDGLAGLVQTLRDRGYRVVGPTVRDGAVVYDDLESADELPAGWTDVQAGGHYRLERRDDQARFGYAVGPHSWKQFLFPPRSLMWSATRTQDGFEVETPQLPDDAPYAFFGARSCELHAIAIQDRVFLEGSGPDAIYAANRRRAFVVAVNCGEPGGTCFCVSMETGPKATFGFDLALTELLDDARHAFLVEVGTAEGAAILDVVPNEPANEADIGAAQRVVDSTAARMGREMDTTGIQQLLADNLEHPRWDDVASRCLTCANCTLVCPTCFCHGIEDTTDLSGDHSERWRSWDSCFTLDYSYVHGGTVRSSARSRYRQWLTHKLGTWFDQFGTSGCVGCGRCITWCPVGIDLTEEVRALRADPSEQQAEENL
jgi:sulfhydrogenase subunit beta (sulfur reductase)